MLGTFQHWKLCYALLDRFISWLKTTKLPRKTFLSYFLFRIGTLQMQMDFSLSWHKKCTKIHLRLSNTPSSLNLLSKNTKISFNHTRWIQIILSFPPQGITGDMAKTASWKSEIPTAELHNYSDVDKQGNAVDPNLSWEGKWAETNWILEPFFRKLRNVLRETYALNSYAAHERDASMHNPGLWSTLFPRSTNGKITYVIILKPKLKLAQGLGVTTLVGVVWNLHI